MAEYDVEAEEGRDLLSRAYMRFDSRAEVRAQMREDVAQDCPVRAMRGRRRSATL